MIMEKVIAEMYYKVEATIPADYPNTDMISETTINREKELFRAGVRAGLKLAREMDLLASDQDLPMPDVVTFEGWL